MEHEQFVWKQLLYENALGSANDISAFRMEGEAVTSFPFGRLRMENALDESEGQKSNFVLWCPVDFPDCISVSWDYWPIREPGLSMMFFAANGRGGEDLFDPALNSRAGMYEQYTHGDICAYHVSYFRRKHPSERRFHTTNLRKSFGFHLVAQGADPIPSVQDAKGPYHIRLIKYGVEIKFAIDGLTLFRWRDDGALGGPPFASGKIGLRQMAPLIAEYANLRVHAIERIGGAPL